MGKEVKGIFKRIFSKGEEGNKLQSSQTANSRQPASNGLPSAVAFVDYEHWYISLNNNYGIKPNIKAWFEDLSERVNIKEIYFFADFSHKNLADEIGRIRPYTNKIIDTRSPFGVKKDFTDFIILDNIYQKALAADDIEAFILFSGDGHFSSVTSFLKNFYNKEVGLYAIKGSVSRQLQETTSWCVQLPDEAEMFGAYYQRIFEFLKGEEERCSKVLPTCARTVDALSKDKKLEKDKINTALKKLLADGVITLRKVGGKSSDKSSPIFVDWELVMKKGLFTPKE